ncbi:MAG TPA: hypothetical protein VFC57_01140 [Aeromicrobium sp.]|nr:hypothetical protein [Aeromicrobium sp.]
MRWFDPSGTRTAEDLAELYARLAVHMVQADSPAAG